MRKKPLNKHWFSTKVSPYSEFLTKSLLWLPFWQQKETAETRHSPWTLAWKRKVIPFLLFSFGVVRPPYLSKRRSKRFDRKGGKDLLLRRANISASFWKHEARGGKKEEKRQIDWRRRRCFHGRETRSLKGITVVIRTKHTETFGSLF